MGTYCALYPSSFQESIKPGSFDDTSSTVIVLVALQSLVEAFEDECPKTHSRTKITYILSDMS